MKVIKTKPRTWEYDSETNRMVLYSESFVALNFEGHGAEHGDTVEVLIAKLMKLDPKASVHCFDDNDKEAGPGTGRMVLCIEALETREETRDEEVSRVLKDAADARNAAELEQSRANSKSILKKVLDRSKVSRVDRIVEEISTLEGVALMLLAELSRITDVAELSDLNLEIATVQSRLEQLNAELEICNRAT